MTLTKASKILTPDTAEHIEASVQEVEEAEKLGVEAMKWVKRYRPRNKVDKWSLLPGETEK